MKECDKECGFDEGMWQSIVWPDAIIWQWCDLMKEFEFDLRQNVTWNLMKECDKSVMCDDSELTLIPVMGFFSR